MSTIYMAKNYRIIVKTVISYMITEPRIEEMEKSKNIIQNWLALHSNSDIYARRYVTVVLKCLHIKAMKLSTVSPICLEMDK